MSVDDRKNLISPFYYGIGSIFATPLVVLILLAMAVLLAITWPIIPFVCYLQRKAEI